METVKQAIGIAASCGEVCPTPVGQVPPSTVRSISTNISRFSNDKLRFRQAHAGAGGRRRDPGIDFDPVHGREFVRSPTPGSPPNARGVTGSGGGCIEVEAIPRGRASDCIGSHQDSEGLPVCCSAKMLSSHHDPTGRAAPAARFARTLQGTRYMWSSPRAPPFKSARTALRSKNGPCWSAFAPPPSGRCRI